MKNLTINPKTSESAQLTIGSSHSVKFYATKGFEANSLTMRFLMPKNVRVEYIQLVDYTEVKFNVVNDRLNLTWFFPVSPKQPDIINTVVEDGGLFMTIDVTITNTFEIGETLTFELDSNFPDNEITTGFFVTIPDAVLNEDVLQMGKLTLTQQKSAQGYSSKPILPVCSNCEFRSGNRCIQGGFVTALKGSCMSYKKSELI